MPVLVLCIGDLHIPYRVHDLPKQFRRLLTPGKITQILSTGNISDRETYEWLGSVVGGMGAVKGVRGGWDDNPSLPPSLVVSHPPLRIGVIQGHQAVPLGDTETLSSIARKMDVDVLVSGGTHRFEAFEHEGRFFINPGSATGAYHPLFSPPPRPLPQTSSSEQKQQASSSQQEGKTGDEAGGEDGTETSTEPNPSGNENAAANRSNGSQSPKVSGEDETAKSSEQQQTSTAAGGSGDDPNNNTPSLMMEPVDPIPSFALLDIQGTVIVTYVYQLIDGEVKVEKIEFRKNVGIPGATGQ